MNVVQKFSRWSNRLEMYTDHEPTTHWADDERERTVCGLNVFLNGAHDYGWRSAGQNDWVSCRRCVRIAGPSKGETALVEDMARRISR